jgi:hypothetical protein
MNIEFAVLPSREAKQLFSLMVFVVSEAINPLKILHHRQADKLVTRHDVTRESLLIDNSENSEKQHLGKAETSCKTLNVESD